MRSISQRELRNNSAEIMRGLARGESYRVTNRGVPVGVLRAEGRSELDDLMLRPGSQVMQFPRGVRRAQSTGDALDELRRDR
ncbi:type II toxin-antitoxin system prevent-host-death family antitoxin [Agromyces neolithicus]|uniref:Antitoxin n=1 Tax=Agromyces neolithicus TaxID=269420 RepID=A0ABN2M9A3_9MICO